MTASLSRLAARAILAAPTPPEPVRHAARLHILDSIGVGIAASVLGPVRGLASAGSLGGSGSCTVIGRRDGVDAATAALVNGSLIHSLEFDDTHAASIMHGSSAFTPAALAVAEECGSSFARLLDAYVLGWEFAIRLGLDSGVALQSRGFQVTSVLGPFATAVIAALLRGTDEDGLTRALGVAASQPAGSFAFLESAAFTKSMQPGWASHSGILADSLARAGVTSAEHSLDGRYGLLSLYTNLGDTSEAEKSIAERFSDLGTSWLTPEAAFKMVPCCHYIHPYVDAVRSTLAAGIAASEIDRVVAHVPTEVVSVIAEPWPARQRISTAHEGRWSLPYVLGLVFAHERVALTDFDGEPDEAALAVAARCELAPWPDSGFPRRFPAWIETTATDGRTHVAQVDDVLGGATRPVSDQDVHAKFGSNARHGLAGSDVDELRRLVIDENDPDLAAIARLLRQVRTPA